MDESNPVRSGSRLPRPLPGGPPLRCEIIAIGDVHGQARLLEACLDEIARTPRIRHLERVIVFLGDLMDRAPDSLGAIRLAMNATARGRADRTVLLPGNHELFLMDALDGGDPALWLGNGGATMMQEVDRGWRRLRWDDGLRLLREALPAGFVETICASPSHLSIGDLLFVHAGLDPDAEDAVHLDRDRPVDDMHWAWIRHEFLTWTGGWDVDPETGDREMGPTIVVHGHTPALRGPFSGDSDALAPLDGIDTHRAICLDAGAAYRPQIGWARFWPEHGTNLAQINVTFEAGQKDDWLP